MDLVWNRTQHNRKRVHIRGTLGEHAIVWPPEPLTVKTSQTARQSKQDGLSSHPRDPRQAYYRLVTGAANCEDQPDKVSNMDWVWNRTQGNGSEDVLTFYGRYRETVETKVWVHKLPGRVVSPLILVPRRWRELSVVSRGGERGAEETGEDKARPVRLGV
ncbi:hypothetical protein ElyMa_000865400 [Elysia marginata]|uniref:Uncharacterized protein n=1 Tax=Elysia marginata TaxID=1093978 RepID=A0AAV4H3S1_9GAST|nr:hypothetical protein ElyMa_000865400 [Elysia marginata]